VEKASKIQKSSLAGRSYVVFWLQQPKVDVNSALQKKRIVDKPYGLVANISAVTGYAVCRNLQRDWIPNLHGQYDLKGNCEWRILVWEENDRLTAGQVPNHFAYLIEGSLLWAAQREVFEAVLSGSAQHHFVTGGSLLDEVSREQPESSCVPTVQN
jgi:hypothetical protein